MRQRGYAIAFALVLVAIVVGTFFGGRFVAQRLRQDFQFRRDWTPTELSTQAATAVEVPQPPEAEVLAPTRRPTPSQVVVPTPVAPSPEPFTPAVSSESTPEGPATAAQPATAEATVVIETPTSYPTPVPAEPFRMRGSVRTSFGDCGGTYVLGIVTDANGAPLPGIRLRLVDEFANEAFAVTKSGQADMGRYDFPVSGPPRRFSVSVVDEGGSDLSRSAGFAYYGDSADAEATCYRVDWQRR